MPADDLTDPAPVRCSVAVKTGVQSRKKGWMLVGGETWVLLKG